MDVGIFKVNRMRLFLWLAVPPALAIGLGLSSYALRLSSEWKLKLTSKLAEILPALVFTQEQASGLLADFQNSASRTIQSEDQLISYVQGVAQHSGFTIDTLKVDRRVSAVDDVPMLKAQIIGLGTIDTVKLFLAEVGEDQHLLSEKMLKLTRSASAFEADLFQVEMELELLLFNSVVGAGGL